MKFLFQGDYAALDNKSNLWEIRAQYMWKEKPHLFAKVHNERKWHIYLTNAGGWGCAL